MTKSTVAFAALAGYAAAQQAYGYGSGVTTTSPSATVPGYTPQQTSSCPAPGTTGSQGYSCNPAHQYPQGQECNLSNGCYILTTVSVDVPQYTSSATAPGYTPQQTTSCPAPGTTGSQGYSCNPAHQYPQGQECNLSNGCYILTTVSVDVPQYTPAPSSSSSQTAPASYPTSSVTSCPAPGTNGPDGRYSCNPAHQYPDNQFCLLSDGCYYLVNQGPGVSAPPSYTNVSSTKTLEAPKYTTEVETAYTTYCPQPTVFTHEQKTYTITKATTITLPCSGGCTVTKSVSQPPSYPTSSSACPAPGTTGSQGYSCNPAHQYPEGQQCNLSNGCYILTTVSVDIPHYTPAPSSPVAPKPPVYTQPSGSVPPVKPSGSVPPQSQAPPAYTHPAPGPSSPVKPSGSAPPSGQAPPPAYTQPAPGPSSPVKPSGSLTPSSYAPPASSVTKPSATAPAVYTGAASLKTSAPIVAVVAFGALFL